MRRDLILQMNSLSDANQQRHEIYMMSPSGAGIIPSNSGEDWFKIKVKTLV